MAVATWLILSCRQVFHMPVRRMVFSRFESDARQGLPDRTHYELNSQSGTFAAWF